MSGKTKLSVILPTSNRYHIAQENIENILTQDHPSFEIVVCDDSDAKYHKEKSAAFIEFVAKLDPKVKYFYTAMFDKDGKKDYGLARARNTGIIEASGKHLVFLDDRMTPANPNVLSLFTAAINRSDKVWYFGDKGAHKESFVENFSAIRRCEMIDAGLFCERINKYGGMTRELHGRFTRQGFSFKYMPECLAKQLCKSSGWDKKEAEIPEMKDLIRKMITR